MTGLAREERERLLRARDRATAAMLSIDSAEDLAVACPGIGEHADLADWYDPDAERRLTAALARRALDARRALLEVIAALARRRQRAVLAEALDVSIATLDGMLDELAGEQANDLRRAEVLAGVLRRARPPEAT